MWNGGLRLSNPETAALYRLRLGKPLTDEKEENGVHYRVFERGLVTVNPDKAKAASITLAPPIPAKRLFDVCGSGTNQGQVIDLTATGKLEIPKYSGRVHLFVPDAKDQLAVSGPTLTVVTAPALGEVRFRVDSFDYWTHSGSWTTEYTLGPNFGKFSITFAKPGKHVIEIVDVVPADMKTPKGYGSGERPEDPTWRWLRFETTSACASFISRMIPTTPS